MIPKASRMASLLGVKALPVSPRKEDPLRKDLALVAPPPRPPLKAGDKPRPLSYLQVRSK